MSKEIPFEVHHYDEHHDKHYKQDLTRHKTPQKKPRIPWKVIGFLGALALGYGIHKTSQLLERKAESNQYPHALEQQSLPQGNIAGIIFENDTMYFAARDSFMRDLAAKKNYVNIDDLVVDKDTLALTKGIVDNMNFTQLMQTSNLNGMIKKYTDFNGNTISFPHALDNLWDIKLLKMRGRFSDLATSFVQTYDQQTTPKSTLQEYKQNMGEELEAMLHHFDKEQFFEKHAHPQRQRFFENYLSHLNENVLMSYCLTELFPDINPGLNAAVMDKLLREAGPEFALKIPAVHDKYLSFGPFQLTSKIITPEGAPTLNDYFPEKFRIPASMKYYDTQEEHVRGAIMSILYNAEILANKLYTDNQLTNFNDAFEQLTPRQQELFLAGQIASAHHFSSKAASGVRDYMREVEQGTKKFDDIITAIDYSAGLNNYYDQSVRNYLTLEALDEFQEKNKK